MDIKSSRDENELESALIAATYQAVRAEIQIIQAEYMSGMKYALFGSAAMYTWLLSTESAARDLPIAWWIPLVLSLFIAGKSILASVHMRAIANFVRIRYAEKFRDPADCWEFYVLEMRKDRPAFGLVFMYSSILFWLALITTNFVVPLILMPK